MYQSDMSLEVNIFAYVYVYTHIHKDIYFKEWLIQLWELASVFSRADSSWDSGRGLCCNLQAKVLFPQGTLSFALKVF